MSSRMMFTTTLRASIATGSRTTTQIVSRRAISTTSARGLKENASIDADHEKHKQDSLKKQAQGQGHWKPELASASEEAVKSDRTEQVDMKTLQERTKKAAEEMAKHGTSMKDSGM